MPVTDEVELDITAALASVDELGTSLTQVIASFQSDLEAAIGSVAEMPATVADVTITPTIDTGEVVAGLGEIQAAEDAVAAEPLTIDVDTSGVGAAADEVGTIAAASDEASASLQALAATDVVVNVDDGGLTELAGAAEQAEVAVESAATSSADLAAIQGDVGTTAGGAAEEIVSLSGAATAASGGLNSMAGVTAAVESGIAATAATVGELASSLSSKLGPAIGAVTGIAVGLGAGLGVLGAFTDSVVKSATASASATERFNLILDEQAATVNRVDIGGLNTDLGTLVNSLGSGSDAVRQFDASFFQLGQSAGASGGDIAETTVQINALAARAVALNPELGTVGETADALQKALARGGQFASRFGISLESVDINARAAEIALARGSETVSQYDKIAAGAALTTERLGNSLATDIEEGSKNVAFSFKRLEFEFKKALVAIGTPLISPVLELLTESLPVGIEFAQVLGSMSATVLPLFVNGLRAAGPFLKILTDGVQEIVTKLEPGMRRIGAAIAYALSDPRNIENVKSLTRSLNAMADAIIPLIPLIADNLVFSINIMAASFAAAVAPLEASINLLNQAHDLLFDEDPRRREKAREENERLEGIKTFGRVAVDAFRDVRVAALGYADAVFAAFDLSTDPSVIIAAAAKTTRDEFLTTAGVIVETLDEVGSSTRLSADSLAFLGINIGELRDKSEAEIREIGEAVGLNGDQFLDWSKRVSGYIDTVVKAAESALPKISDAFQLKGEPLQDASTIEFQLLNQEKKVREFQKNIETLHARGLDNLVEQLLTEGPVVGGALADALVKGAPQRAQALNDQLISTKQAFNDLLTYVRDEFGPAFAVETGVAAEAGGRSFGTKLGPALTAAVTGATTEAFRELQTQTLILGSLFYGQGVILGNELSAGFSDGVDQLAGNGVGAVGSMASDSIRIAKQQLGINSPSTVFEAIGRNIVEGMTIGINDSGWMITRAVGSVIAPALAIDDGDTTNSLSAPGAYAQFKAANAFVDQYKKNQMNLTIAPQITFPADMSNERAAELTGVVTDTIAPAMTAALRAEMAAS